MPHTVKGQLQYLMLKHRLLIFLIGLVASLLFFPLVVETYAGYHLIMEIFFSIVLLLAIFVLTRNREIFTVAVLLALLAFTVISFNTILHSKHLLLTGLVLEITFFVLATSIIISHVLVYRKITVDKIFGAICGYLLIGIIWALIYTTVENYTPGSFYFSRGLDAPPAPFGHPFYFAQFLYFSFITLTTTGYGDIVPASTATRALCSLEAVIGQLYVAVLIARIVGMHMTRQLARQSSRQSAKD
jgi:voltage-gated potassium channel